jgi:hypothetical protein
MLPRSGFNVDFRKMLLDIDKPKLVSALGYLGSSYSFLQTGEPAAEAEEVLWQVERALKDGEISSPPGLAAWREGELIILMVPGALAKLMSSR